MEFIEVLMIRFCSMSGQNRAVVVLSVCYGEVLRSGEFELLTSFKYYYDLRELLRMLKWLKLIGNM